MLSDEERKAFDEMVEESQRRVDYYSGRENTKGYQERKLELDRAKITVAVAAHLRELEGALCRAREALIHIHEYWNGNRNDSAMWDALTHIVEEADITLHNLHSTTPCPHAARAEKAEAEAKRLKEWMSRYKIPRKYGDRPDTSILQLWEEAELRRRAEKEG